jgi:hypothetical protein
MDLEGALWRAIVWVDHFSNHILNFFFWYWLEKIKNQKIKMVERKLINLIKKNIERETTKQ